MGNQTKDDELYREMCRIVGKVVLEMRDLGQEPKHIVIAGVLRTTLANQRVKRSELEKQAIETVIKGANGADITCVHGAEEAYFFSTQTMTANYASMCVQVVENDICRAIAEAVRFDCQTYPRPYKVAMLTQPPYSFGDQQVAAALSAMETHPDYADIRTVESSNAEPYLFSERFMSYGKAYGLCEWFEVEQYQNP